MCAKCREVRCMFKKNSTLLNCWRVCMSVKMVLFSVSGLKDEKLIKKRTYIKTLKTKTANSIF